MSKSNKEKLLLVISILFNISTINADVVDVIATSNYIIMIRPEGSRRYIGTLFVKNNNLSIIYESDAGYNPTIMAYNISADNISLVIKSRWLGINNEIAYRPDGKSPSYYYLLELTENNGKIDYKCNLMNNVELVNFTFTNGIINDNNVDVRKYPNPNGTVVIQLNKNIKVNVIAISQEIDEIDNLIDYWYNVNIDNEYLWIYGYYIDFSQEIMLK